MMNTTQEGFKVFPLIGYLFGLIVIELILLFCFTDVFACGQAYLDTYEQSFNGFLFFLGILIFQFIIAAVLVYKKKNVFFIVLFVIISLLTVIPLLHFGSDAFGGGNLEFDKEKWEAVKEKPLRMIRAFYRDERFIGMAKVELESIVGEGEERLKTTDCMEDIFFYTDCFESPLVFDIENGVVVEVRMECHD